MVKRLSSSRRTLVIGALLATLGTSVFVLNSCVRGAARIAGVPDRIDYNWHVRPILSENCFRCHGPDAKARQASLRLDVPEVAFAELKESPGKYAIVRGHPDRSELIRRITATDPEMRMPPPSLHKVLSETQIATLREWIDQGAEYKPHWSYLTASEPRVPHTRSASRVANEIDRFVFARLEREGAEPSPEADKETLINRVSLTLTGLPPTLEDVDAFVADTSPNAYEKLVDRLLASPAYAEHMASYWMNLARWSESDGFLDDHHDRFLWPWRDWVIEAFNENMPFDQFSTWQLAGDLLPDRTKEQLLATAFLRIGKRTTENGAIDEEYRVEYVIDRTNTTGTAFLGLTVGCAQCHDHKYDSISHKDYYSLSGFFNSADEPGYYAPGHSAVQGGPTLPWPDHDTEAQIADLEAKIREREGSYRASRQMAEADAASAVSEVVKKSADDSAATIRASIDRATVAYYPFETTTPADESKLPPRFERQVPPRELVSLRRENRNPAVQVVPNQPASPKRRPSVAASREAGLASPKRQAGAAASREGGPDRAPSRMPSGYAKEGLALSPSGSRGVAPAILQSPILRNGIKGHALFFDETNKGFLPSGVGAFDRTQEFSLDLWFYPDQAYESTPNDMLNRTGKGLPYGTPILQHRDDDNSGGAGYRLQLEDGHLWFYLAHSRPANMIAVKTREPVPVKQWMQITVTYDGSSQAAGTKIYLNGEPADLEVDHDSLTRSILPHAYASVFDQHVGLSFGSRFREKAPVGSGLDEIRIFNRELTPLEVTFLHDPIAARATESLQRGLTEVSVANDPRVVSAKAQLTEAREAHNKVMTLVPQVLVMGDAPKLRPAHRLDRGVYSQRAEEVPVRGLAQIFPWDESLPSNRLGLARWLFDPKHPLTSRVFVNRMWQMHFGKGLVETSEDFGVQGAIPTHPELLDWLAVGFTESGWDIKRLHKLIVMSSTYRQSSDATGDSLARDPENRLLTRGFRQRMSAEVVRDHALMASGLLIGALGGPSVHPYQPEGIWNPLNSFYRYPEADAVPADEHHRRSLYTFIKRNAPHPGMQIFDFADPNVSTARRRTSNTPLQALELMNDPQFVEAYRLLATHALQRDADHDAQLRTLFRLATRRSPTEEQLALLREYRGEEETSFANDKARAAALLETGVTPADASLDQVQLAAMTNVAALVMNSPDAYSIR